MKICGKCKVEKDESAFHKTVRTKDGLQSTCKKCRSERSNLSRTKGIKKCRQCGNEKPVEQFYVKKANVDGRQPVCKTCQKTTVKEWYNETRVERLLYAKKYRCGNSYKAVNKKWALNNKDHKKRFWKFYYENNKDVLKSKWYPKKKHNVESLAIQYIKDLLKRSGWTSELIERYPILLQLKKLEIINKRLLKSVKNDNKSS